MAVPVSIPDSNGTLLLQALNTAFDETIQHVGTIAALRTITPTSSSMIIAVTGYYTAADNIGVREYYWDATSTEADIGGTIIQVTGVVTGRWKMKYSGAVNVKWFGAKGDGASDDTTPIQNTINFLKINGTTIFKALHFPDGIFIVSSTIIIDGHFKLKISSDGAILRGSIDAPILSVINSQWLNLDNINIENLIDATTAINSSCLSISACYLSSFRSIKMYGGRNTLEHTGNNNTFYSCSTRDGYNGFYTASVGNNTSNSFYGCAFERAINYNLFFDYSSSTYGNYLFSGCYLESGAVGEVYVKNGMQVHMEDCYFNIDDNAYCFTLDGTLPIIDSISVNNCKFGKLYTTGYIARSLSASIISGIVFSNNNIFIGTTLFNALDTYKFFVRSSSPTKVSSAYQEMMFDGNADNIPDTFLVGAGGTSTITSILAISDRGYKSTSIATSYLYTFIQNKQNVGYTITSFLSTASTGRIRVYDSAIVTLRASSATIGAGDTKITLEYISQNTETAAILLYAGATASTYCGLEVYAHYVKGIHI